MGSKQNNFYYYIKQMENISEKSEKMGDWAIALLFQKGGDVCRQIGVRSSAFGRFFM